MNTSLLLPGNFVAHPIASIAGNSETETVAANIMRILKRTGNTWRKLSWVEYVKERKTEKSSTFTDGEQHHFENCEIFNITTAQDALNFCKDWVEQTNAIAPRYKLDKRIGCIGIIDTWDEDYDPDHQGLHQDDPGVVAFATGIQVDKRSHTECEITDAQSDVMEAACDELNAYNIEQNQL